MVATADVWIQTMPPRADTEETVTGMSPAS